VGHRRQFLNRPLGLEGQSASRLREHDGFADLPAPAEMRVVERCRIVLEPQRVSVFKTARSANGGERRSRVGAVPISRLGRGNYRWTPRRYVRHDLAAAVKETHPLTPVILVTGSDHAPAEQSGVRSPFDATLKKPCGRLAIITAITKLCE
jgi:hypothetical protein